MASIIKRFPDGKLMAARTTGPDTLLLRKAFLMVGERRVDILHFLNHQTRVLTFALRNPRLPMLGKHSATNRNFPATGERQSCNSHHVQYDGIVYFQAPDFRITETAWLTNAEGYVLSGSNIYGSSFRGKAYGVCLGSSFNPLCLQPVELLLYNQANRDLEWVGPSLPGKWLATGESVIGSVFAMSSWPPSEAHKSPVPPEVVAMTQALWPAP